MNLSATLRTAASRTIKRLGGLVSIRYVTAGAYNATDGSVTETTSDTEVRGVVTGINAREVNELVQATDKRLTVAASEVPSVPTTKDRVLISGVVHEIVAVDTIEQDNESITHELVLRG